MAVESAGLTRGQRAGSHQLRHRYASVLLAGGVDIKVLSEYLGHADAGFTLRVYSHLMPAAEGRVRRANEPSTCSGFPAMTVKPNLVLECSAPAF